MRETNGFQFYSPTRAVCCSLRFGRFDESTLKQQRPHVDEKKPYSLP